MRWGVFAIMALVFLVLDMSAAMALEITGMRPSFTVMLALYISLWAPRQAALWACLILGFLVDLASPRSYPPAQALHLVGPHALGFSFACILILQVRAMVMRRQTFATAILALVFMVAASIVVVALYTIRSWFPGNMEFDGFAPLRELLYRLGDAVYTGLAAIPVAWLLLLLGPLWNFQTGSGARMHWRQGGR